MLISFYSVLNLNFCRISFMISRFFRDTTVYNINACYVLTYRLHSTPEFL
jgi:hypothetical protein